MAKDREGNTTPEQDVSPIPEQSVPAAPESDESPKSRELKEAIQSEDNEDADVEEITRRAFSENLRKEYKPRRKRGLALTLVALVVVLGVVGGLVYIATQYKPPEIVVPDTTVTLTDYAIEDIESVTVAPREGEAFTIAYDPAGSNYKVVGWDSVTPVNQSSLRDVYFSGRMLTAQNTVEENTQNLAGYGFDNPLSRVTVKHVNGQTFEFELGNRLPTGSGYYLRKANENTVYLVNGTVGTRFSQQSRNLRDLNILASVSTDYVNYIYLERAQKDTIELRQEASDITLASWNFTQPELIEADAEAVTELCGKISSISFAAFEETSSDLAKFGLDAPSAVVMMKDTDGNSIHLQIGGAAGENTTYARIAGSSDIYTIVNDKLSFIKDTSITQLAYKFIAIVNIAAVDEVDIDFGGGVTSEFIIDREPKMGEDGKQAVNADGTPAVTDRFYVDGLEQDDGFFRKVYQDLIGLMIRGEVQGDYATAPSVTVDFLFNNERERLKLEFYAYGKDFYAVSRDGGTPLFYTRRADVDTLLDRVNLIKEMPNTRDADKLSAITMIKDGKMTVVDRNAAGAQTIEKLYTELLTSTTSGITQERFTGEPSVTFRFQYSDGREPVTVEYYPFQGSLMAFGTPGSNVKFYMTGSTLDTRIANIESAAQ